MARVTSTEVEDILQWNYATARAPTLTPFITAANLITNRLVTRIAEEEYTALGDDELKEIERWLSAYFYTKMDALYKKKKTDKAEGEFLREPDDYLKAALILDPTGILEELINNYPVVTGGWLGKTDVEALTYDQRMGGGEVP